MTSVIDFRALLREERETARRQASIVAGAHERSGSQSEQGAQSIQRVKELQESAYDKLVETVDKHTDSVDKLRVNPRLVNSAQRAPPLAQASTMWIVVSGSLL